MPDNRDKQKAKEKIKTISSRSRKSNTSQLMADLATREGWQQSINDDDERILIFNNPHAFFNLHLNIDKGLLIAREKEGISGIARQDVKELFATLTDDYNSLGEEAGGSIEEFDKPDRVLKIQIPKPAYYDLFLDKALRKDSLHEQLAEQKKLEEKNKASEREIPEQEEGEMRLSTAPTPFSKTPKPKGYSADN